MNLVGYTEDEVVGQPVTLFLKSPNRAIQELIESVFRIRGRTQTTMQTTDGDNGITLNVIAFPETDAKGHVTAMCLALNQVSESDPPQRTWDQIIDTVYNASDILIVFSLIGKVIYINKLVESLFASEVPALMEMNLSDFFDASSLACLTEEAIPKAMSIGSWSGQLHLKKKLDSKDIPFTLISLRTTHHPAKLFGAFGWIPRP